MEDVLGALAVVVSADDGKNPQISARLDRQARRLAGFFAAGDNDALVSTPLDRIGLKIRDIDKFATEMHNPEITEPAGSGNVPNTNYRMIGGLAVMKKELAASELNGFVRQYGMPGFSPTQGHIAAAAPFICHAREMILSGEIRRAMFVAKGSLFLAKMTKLSTACLLSWRKTEDRTMVADISKDNFQEEVLSASLPVLVDFWGPSCQPCLASCPSSTILLRRMKGS